MTREDALYQKLLLAAGFVEQYEIWLAEFVEKEDPLSDIVLDLSWCGGDFNEIMSCLHRYTNEVEIDEADVAERLRLFVKEQYDSGKINIDKCMSVFYRSGSEMWGNSNPWNYISNPWNYMMKLSDIYELVEDGWYSEKKWSKAFFTFLNEGKMLKL